MNLDVHRCKKGFQSKIKKRMANSVDPDETACSEPSYLDLHYSHKYLFWSAGLKGLTSIPFLNLDTSTAEIGVLAKPQKKE